MKKIVGVFILFFILSGLQISLIAQDSLKTSLKAEAQRLFASKDYAGALKIFEKLLESFPGEPEYRYAAGVSLINLNLDPGRAVQLLQSSEVTAYATDAGYYLARAYHLVYSFDDAIKTYSKYMLTGRKKDIRRFDVERQIEMARNGMKLTKSGSLPEVIETRIIPVTQLQQASEINNTGKLMQKPIEFCSKTDIRNDYRPWMFLPSYTEVNEYVFTAGYEQNKKGSRQLFRIRNFNHEAWGIPEPLREINTRFDEEYPFFDVETSTLYFSSKGHSSMGGYDIFKSVYNWNSKTWSQPENLGFPVNTPFDDYNYITGGKNHLASFVSNRNTPAGKVTLYVVRIQPDTTGIWYTNVEEIRKASALPVQEKKNISETIAFQTEPVTINLTEEMPETVEITPVKNRYNKVLTEALLLQLKADSSARVARDLRILARETPDQEITKGISGDIGRNEKEAARYQKLADQKFAEAREIKQADNMNINSRHDTTITISKEVNGIRVYQYNDTGDALINKKEQSNPSENIADKKDDFTLFDKSPYHDSHPIPEKVHTYAGLIYRIQLGVFSKQKPNDAFGGMYPLAYEKLNSNTIYKYYTGVFYTMNQVNKALELVREKGFPDAFVVAFFDGKPITTEKAKEIEYSDFRP